MSNRPALRWRINDLVIGSVLAVACGFLYWIWGNAGYPLLTLLLSLAPEYASLAGGIWLIAGVLGGLLIRKPGAALYTELLAALVSALLGSQYSWLAVLSGLIQGAAAELVFLLFFYRAWGLVLALLAGALSGLAMGASEAALYYADEMSPAKALTYTLCALVSGLVWAGLGSWLIFKALLPTGVLDSLASGRARRATGPWSRP